MLKLVALIALCASVAECRNDNRPEPMSEVDRWTRYDEMFKKANASVAHTIDGYDVRKKFPGSPSQSWEAFADIRSDIRDDEYAIDKVTVGPLATIQRVGIRPTGDLLDEAGSIRGGKDWGYCMIVRSFSGLDLPIDRDIDPTCNGVISDKCLKWLREFAKDGKACSKVDDPYEFYSWDTTPCSEYRFKSLVGGGSNSGMQPSKYGNVSDLHRIGDGSIMIMEQQPKEDIPYYMPDHMQYYQTISSVWLMIVGWTPGPLETNFSGSEDADRVPDSLICLRTEKFRDGSKTFKDGILKDGGGNKESDKDVSSNGANDGGSESRVGKSDGDDGSGASVVMKPAIGSLAVVLLVAFYAI